MTYCRGGSRGALAAQTLRHLGYKNATNLKGGLKGWAKADYPVETGLGTVVLNKETAADAPLFTPSLNSGKSLSPGLPKTCEITLPSTDGR